MKRLFVSIATALMLAGLFTVAIQPATEQPASASWSECASGHLCYFDNDAGGSPKIIDLSGWIWGFEQHFTGDSATYGCYNFPSGANDKANSVYNHYPAEHKAITFSGFNCVSDEQGSCGSNFVTSNPGTQITFKSHFWDCGLRDVASSVRIKWY